MKDITLELETNRTLTRWILRLANELQMRCATSADEILLFDNPSILNKNWTNLFYYLVHTKYAIELIDYVLFTENKFDKNDSIELERLTDSDLCQIFNNTYEWYKKLPINALKIHNIDNSEKMFQEILSDERSSLCAINRPLISSQITVMAQETTKKWFYAIPDMYLKKYAINQTEKDFYNLLSLKSLELERIDSTILEIMNW